MSNDAYIMNWPSTSSEGFDPSILDDVKKETDSKISAHNTNNSAHQDIRILLQELGTRLNGVLDEVNNETDSKITSHNTNNSAHQDIRILLQEVGSRLNAVLDSDDVTLDQLSEIVEYIKSNKTLIEEVTTKKVNVSDIIANLETNLDNKPLSASAGVMLKSLIDNIKVPTKTSELTNDSNFATKTTLNNAISESEERLSDAISECEKPFVITATANFSNNTLLNISKTFPEIVEAHNRNDHIFLDLDISEFLEGHRCLANLVTLLEDAYAIFEAILTNGNNSTHITALIMASGSTSASMIPLAREDQLPGLTFVVSDTIPTEDNRTVITFVVEE